MSKIEDINERLFQLLPTTEYKITDHKEESFKWATNYQTDVKYLLSIIEQTETNLADSIDFIKVYEPDEVMGHVKRKLELALKAIRGN